MNYIVFSAAQASQWGWKPQEGDQYLSTTDLVWRPHPLGGDSSFEVEEINRRPYPESGQSEPIWLALMASERLRRHDYPHYMQGHPPRGCGHLYGVGDACRECDELLVARTIARGLAEPAMVGQQLADNQSIHNEVEKLRIEVSRLRDEHNTLRSDVDRMDRNLC